MNCPFEEDVSALFDGELAGDDAARVQTHLASCTSCRALLDDLQEIRGALRPLEPLRPPVWRRRISLSLPAAAAIAILLMLAPLVVLRDRTPAPKPASEVFARYDGGGRAVIRVVRR